MLHEAGFLRTDFFVTNVCRYRPPNNDISQWIYEKKNNPPPGFVYHLGKWVHPYILEGYKELLNEIQTIKPDLILALGKTALWALTEKDAIMSWRGSQLETQYGRVLPTIHPTVVLRQWEYRGLVVMDFRRAKRWLNGEADKRNWQFDVRPSFETCLDRLNSLIANANSQPLNISVDLETRAGHIACCGLAWSESEAISIPFMCTERVEGYWDLDQEFALIQKLRELLTHPSVSVIGQNFNYDAQYIWRYWRFIPNLRYDTMVGQALCFPGLPKSLSHIASMYNRHYVFWKDDGREWNPKLPEEQLWSYNCEDCCRTWEAWGSLDSLISKFSLWPQYEELLRRWYAVLQMQIRGVKVDEKVRSAIIMELMNSISEHEEWLTTVCGHPLNVGSAKQMQAFFYEDMRLPIQKHKKSGRATLDDKALTAISTKFPLFSPLIKTIQDLRSLRVFLNTFAKAPLDSDRRMRSEFNIVGTETFRFASSENPFGSGTNLQNLPKGAEKPKPGELMLPNIRKLFIPDLGFHIFDADLDRADLQVVVWEANDSELKQMLREGVDIHTENAKALGISRALAKSWVHGTNYGGSPRTMAMNCGITVHQAERMRKRWFEVHPGIKEWHDRTAYQLQTTRSVYNRFGFRRIYFDRVESILPEALAWIPQSTVAEVINRGLVNIFQNLPLVQVLLQVHDSLVFQLPSSRRDLLPAVRQQLLITIPYDDPLIIPVGLKSSSVSWGHCSDDSWGDV
jgi:DNA polymerase I-like protein with 3'-5' exonuclease and polymerase domains